MKVALELQLCRRNRPGIGTYANDLAKRLTDENSLEFSGNLFNFAGRNDNSQSLEGIAIPVRENRLFPLGVYRRIWKWIPVLYQSLFLGETDLNVFSTTSCRPAGGAAK